MPRNSGSAAPSFWLWIVRTTALAYVVVSESYRCRAVVVTCIDYRFFRWLDGFLRAEQLYGSVDIIAWPGGGASLAHADGEIVGDALAVSFELHAPLEVILVAHQDCGRFNGSAAFESRSVEMESLEAMLQSAARTVETRFGHRNVRAIVFDGDGEAHRVEAVR